MHKILEAYKERQHHFEVLLYFNLVIEQKLSRLSNKRKKVPA